MQRPDALGEEPGDGDAAPGFSLRVSTCLVIGALVVDVPTLAAVLGHGSIVLMPLFAALVGLSVPAALLSLAFLIASRVGGTVKWQYAWEFVLALVALAPMLVPLLWPQLWRLY